MYDEIMKADENEDEIKNEITQKGKSENTDQNLDQKNVIKRKKNIMHDKNKRRRKRIVVEEFSSSSDEDEYSLTVSNLPKDWTYVQIKNYIDKECGPVDEIEMLKHDGVVNCAIRLTFPTSEKCMETMKNLQDKTVDGSKLELQMRGKQFDEESPLSEVKAESCSDTTEIVQNLTPSTVEDDSWSGNPKDLYGLRPQFLKSLGIKPPLERWIHVTNFRCDKSELRDVLELAGHVVMCSVVTVAHKYAKVMYSHPLEAVQAVSMLDGQLFYGQALKVFMDKDPAKNYILPKGLANIGLGLGIHGRPLRNISDLYNKYLAKESTLLNPLLFTAVDAEVDFLNAAEIKAIDDKINNDINEFKESIKNDKILLKIKRIEDLDSYAPHDCKNKINASIQSQPGSFRSNSPDSVLPSKSNVQMIGPQMTPRPIGHQNNAAPGTILPVRLSQQGLNNSQPFRPSTAIPQNVQTVPSFRPGLFNPTTSRQFAPAQVSFRPVPGPNFGPQPVPGPFRAASMPRPQVAVNNMGARPMMGPNVPIRPQGATATVHFVNLPPTTTFPLLSEKLAHCGQVLSVQLTTPGCAVATFAHRAYAERCLQTYNGMNVEGYIINVKII